MGNDRGRWRPSSRFGRSGGREFEERLAGNEITAKGAAGGMPPGLRMGLILGAGALVVVIAALVLIFGRPQGSPDATQPGALATVMPIITQAGAAVSTTMPVPTQRPGYSEETAIDLSASATKANTSHQNLTRPGVTYGEMVYSAGTGSASNAVLKDLQLYNMLDGTETIMAKTALGTDGELFDAYINQRWIVFIDTNHSKESRICFIDRRQQLEEGATPEVGVLMVTNLARPRLSLNGNTLVWIQQNEEQTDDIWVFDLDAGGENFVIATVDRSASYGVSPPSVHGNELIWADQDPDNPTKKQSAIFRCRLDELGGEDIEYEYFAPGMYVHAPVTNGRVWAWLDKERDPTSTLYLKHRNGTKITAVTQGYTQYALGDGVLLYVKDMHIYAYFYDQGIYARLTPAEGGWDPAIDPEGRYAAWKVLPNDQGVDGIMYMEVLLPEESPQPSPTPLPSATARPTAEPIDTDEDGDVIGGDGATPPSDPTTTPTPPATSAP